MNTSIPSCDPSTLRVHTRTLRHIDGTCVVQTGFFARDLQDVWWWASKEVCTREGVGEDAVSVVETPSGDQIAVRGIPLYFLC